MLEKGKVFVHLSSGIISVVSLLFLLGSVLGVPGF